MNKDTIMSQDPGAIMAQLIDPIPSDETNLICCCYVNATSKIQVARITNLPNWYFERVVFPGQRLLFEALPAGHLEIHTGMMASAILSDTIPCTQLQITDDDVAEPPYTVEEERRLEAKNEGHMQPELSIKRNFESAAPDSLRFQMAQAL